MHNVRAPSRCRIESLTVLASILAAEHYLPTTQDLGTKAEFAPPITLEAKQSLQVSMLKVRNPCDRRLAQAPAVVLGSLEDDVNVMRPKLAYRFLVRARQDRFAQSP